MLNKFRFTIAVKTTLLISIANFSSASEPSSAAVSTLNTTFAAPVAQPPMGYKVIAGPKLHAIQQQKSAFDHLPITPNVPQTYAYGWFGSKPSPQWSRHFGANRRYTQWSLK